MDGCIDGLAVAAARGQDPHKSRARREECRFSKSLRLYSSEPPAKSEKKTGDVVDVYETEEES